MILTFLFSVLTSPVLSSVHVTSAPPLTVFNS